jgi:hypothetical protein
MAEETTTPAVPPVTEPAAPAAAETPPTTTTPPATKEPDTRFSERLAHLARRERILVQKQEELSKKETSTLRQLQEKEAAIKAQEESLAQVREEAAKWERLRKDAKTDPGAFLRGLYGEGWYDALAEYKLADEKRTPADLQVQAVRETLTSETSAIRKELEELRKQREEERKQAEQAERERIQQEQVAVLQRFESETIDFVKQSGDKYWRTNLFGRQDLVPKLIKQVYEESSKTGAPKILSREEASQQVEEYFESVGKQYKEAESKYSAPPPTSQPKPNEASAPTLTNGLASTPAMPSVPVYHTSDERMKRALEAWTRVEAGKSQ